MEYSEDTSLSDALKWLKEEVVKCVNEGKIIIHLKESLPEKRFLPINALLAVGCVHQHLVKTGLRSKVNIVISSSSARDTHQIACLIGFGAKLSMDQFQIIEPLEIQPRGPSELK